MVKIIFASIILVGVVLGLNFIWPSVSPLSLNPSDGQKLIQNFQETQKAIPQRVMEGITGAAGSVQKSITSYFMEKTGKEIVDIIETLPSGQQETIKKEYCGTNTD